MPLSFYLLKPVKRVTEYPLLVEKLLKHTPQDHADYHNTQEYICNIIILSKYQYFNRMVAIWKCQS